MGKPLITKRTKLGRPSQDEKRQFSVHLTYAESQRIYDVVSTQDTTVSEYINGLVKKDMNTFQQETKG